MNQIAELMNHLATDEGINNTLMSGVRVFKTSHYQPRQPLCYDQGFLFVGQGSKRVFLGNNSYDYNPDNYLVVSVPLPAECETNATEEEPLLLLFIDIDLGMLNHIIEKMKVHQYFSRQSHEENQKGLFVAEADLEIKQIVTKLLTTLQSPIETDIIGKNLIEELIFRIMCGENASSLYALAMKNTNFSRIGKVLKQIHQNYPEFMDVENLAGIANMSQSAFYRAFRDITASSPIQYIKRIRLNKAKELLIKHGMRVNEAATEVGYESAAQFSREFKRYFGITPVSYTLADHKLQVEQPENKI